MTVATKQSSPRIVVIELVDVGKFPPIVLRLTETFYGREDTSLFNAMLPELPGILLWAIEGLKRLRSRGHFLQPASSQDAIAEMEDLASPVGAFVRDYCDVAPGKTIPSTELFEAWKSWCKSQGREHAGTIQIFGRDLRAAVAGLKIGRPREDGGRIRTYEGIDLSAAVRREMLNEMAGRMEAHHANA